MTEPCVVTIDGPAGVGKSTLARRLAEKLGLACLDTGAMFRMVALRLGADGVERARLVHEYDEELAGLLEASFFCLEGTGEGTRLLCNGSLVGDETRSESAGMMAAQIGGNSQVREYLKKEQRRLGGACSLVTEGRDMGTAVFPSAFCKIFLEADPVIRAKRRYLQLQEMGKTCSLDELAEQIRQRDEQDRNRPVAPLLPASDAIIIDTSHKSLEDVEKEVLAIVQKKLRQDAPPDCPMRRKDRAWEPDKNLALIGAAEYGVLALADGAWPYALPLSFVLLDGALYFHCALEGRKVRVMDGNNRCCFTVVGATKPVYDRGFSTYYESVMVFGRVTPVTDRDEKNRVLFALAEKYLPDDMDKVDADIARSLARTAVYRIFPEKVTGKSKC